MAAFNTNFNSTYHTRPRSGQACISGQAKFFFKISWRNCFLSSIINFLQILWPTGQHFCAVGALTSQAIAQLVKQSPNWSAKFLWFFVVSWRKKKFCANFIAHWSKFKFKICCRGPLKGDVMVMENDQRTTIRILTAIFRNVHD